MQSRQTAANDAFTRICGALASPKPLGSTLNDWREKPDAFQPAAVHHYVWPNVLRYDESEHEVSRDARAFGYAMLAEYVPGKVGSSLAAMARKHGISTDYAARVMRRVDELTLNVAPEYRALHTVQ